MKLLFLCFVVLLSNARAAETPRYFLYLFGTEDEKQQIRNTHTWGVFLKVVDAKIREKKTISWMPESDVVDPLKLGPERGRNKPLSESFSSVTDSRGRLGQWGPYEITSVLYELAEKQIAAIERKTFWYKVIDIETRIVKRLDPTATKLPLAANCIHVLSDTVLDADKRGFLLTGRKTGFLATEAVAWHFEPWYVDKGNVDKTWRERLDKELDLTKQAPQRFALRKVENGYCKTIETCTELEAKFFEK